MIIRNFGDLSEFLTIYRGVISTGATCSMAPVNFDNMPVGTHGFKEKHLESPKKCGSGSAFEQKVGA